MPLNDSMTRIRILTDTLELSLRERCKSYGLEQVSQDVVLLVTLRDAAALPVTSLCKAIGASRTNVYMRLKAMEKKGWVTRYSRPEDKRATYIRLTEEGSVLAARLEAVLKEWEEDVFGRLQPPEVATFLETIGQIMKFAKNAGLVAFLRKRETIKGKS